LDAAEQQSSTLTLRGTLSGWRGDRAAATHRKDNARISDAARSGSISAERFTNVIIAYQPQSDKAERFSDEAGPGNANLLIGVFSRANREIGVPGWSAHTIRAS